MGSIGVRTLHGMKPATVPVTSTSKDQSVLPRVLAREILER
ncbi:MAG: hypothetical protein WA631_01630 [Nitrososphaeraceae archaeon]